MNNWLPKLNKKAFSVAALSDESEEKKYWLSKKPHERLIAIEINRRMVYGSYRVTSRLQRFLDTEDLKHLP
jgi:hypothetical protein